MVDDEQGVGMTIEWDDDWARWMDICIARKENDVRHYNGSFMGHMITFHQPMEDPFKDGVSNRHKYVLINRKPLKYRYDLSRGAFSLQVKGRGIVPLTWLS